MSAAWSELDAEEPAEDPAFQARWRRAAGDIEGALAVSERALGAVGSGATDRTWGVLLELEVAANLLAMGDVSAAESMAAGAKSRLGSEASFHLLNADLVLCEIARSQGRHREAVSRLLEHAGYIRTESANLLIALYIRAFPGLLGVVAEAVDPSRLPVHMLRLIGHDESIRALGAAWPEIPRDEWRVLAERLLEPDEVDGLEGELQDHAPCQVRFFGGLEVTTPDGVIPDRAWRKRKARLAFAMLAAKRGQDIPREQVLDHLWPDMPEEKARNNFYVVWNTLKGALSPRLPKGEACPYVESVGGLCRVNPALVRSDLDDFEEILGQARRAEAEGEQEAALSAYRRLEEVYRGNLLPGDVYDDWFGALRERCRQQFGDAMLRASRLAEEVGRGDATLHSLRRGLDQDPLREDLYQEMLRRQIDAGMRGAAVETYMACRSQLAEELGLDPSAETRLLYDQVLAMEDTPPREPLEG